VVFVFDITKSKSLENLNEWHKLFVENQEAPGIVVANKMDLLNARYSCLT
jgi:GTPase SAR1 family protein